MAKPSRLHVVVTIVLAALMVGVGIWNLADDSLLGGAGWSIACFFVAAGAVASTLGFYLLANFAKPS